MLKSDGVCAAGRHYKRFNPFCHEKTGRRLRLYTKEVKAMRVRRRALRTAAHLQGRAYTSPVWYTPES
jgi:hypothetical protein